MMFLLFLLLAGAVPASSGNAVSIPETVPSVTVVANHLEIWSSDPDPEKSTISVTLDCTLNGPGSFSEQEGPHQLELSALPDNWTIPIHPENLYFPPPLASRADFGRQPQRANQREMRTWYLRLHTKRCSVPKTATTFRLKGNLVFHIAPRTYMLPPIDLTKKGKGYTADIPIPSPALSEDAIALDGYQQTATFTSDPPAISSNFINLSMNYNPSTFQLIDLLILDESHQPASVSLTSSSNNQEKGDAFRLSKQFRAESPKWNQWKVAFSYLIPEETRRISVPVDLEITLSSNKPAPPRQQSAFIVKGSPHTADRIHLLSRSREDIKEDILFHLFQINQSTNSSQGAFSGVSEFTSLGLNIKRRSGTPFLADSFQKGTLYLEGANPEQRIKLESSISRPFAFPNPGIPFFLETPQRLPCAASEGWRLSGTLDLGIADRMYLVEIPLDSPWGKKIVLPLKHIPPGMLPEGATLSMMALDRNPEKFNGSSSRTTRRIVIYSPLPAAHFGKITLFMPDNSHPYEIEPNAAVPFQEGTPAIYDLVLGPKDKEVTASLMLYINPRAVKVPVNLRFGLGGIITEKKEREVP